jgi:tetratricopeptide (TPR) repeat protein
MSPNESQVYVDLGYAYENDGKPDQALQSYTKAISLNDGQYATAYLRAGIVNYRKQDNDNALKMYEKAEQLYRAASNNEGVNEVMRRRGVLYRRVGRYDEAQAQFQQCLDASRAMGLEAQQIYALIDLSFLASARGQAVEAQSYAQQAVTIAEQKKLENLAASGLLELGNSYSSRQDYEKAEHYFNQAIQLARSNKGRFGEALGMMNLSGVYIYTLRVDQGLQLAQQALNFFQQGNYPASVTQCLTQMIRGYRRKGDYEGALKAANQKIDLARKDGSQPEIANAYSELAGVLVEREDLPAAQKQYEDAFNIYESVNNPLRITFNKVNRGNVLWRLGHNDQAEALLDDVWKTIGESKNEYKQLVPTVLLHRAQIRMSQRDYAEAITLSNEAITEAGVQNPEIAIEARSVLGLARAMSGSGREGLRFCDEAINLASAKGDFLLQSRALLYKAEAALLTNDPQTALNLATEAQTRFATGQQYESEWRAWLIASRASEKLGEKNKAQEQFGNAMNVRAKLEQQWGAEAFKQYSSRPDIQAFYKQG